MDGEKNNRKIIKKLKKYKENFEAKMRKKTVIWNETDRKKKERIRKEKKKKVHENRRTIGTEKELV